MKLYIILLCLMALISAATSVGAQATGIEIRLDSNTVQCGQALYADGDNVGVDWIVQIVAGGESVRNLQTIANSEDAQTNVATMDISTLPCSATITCNTNINEDGVYGQGLTRTIIKDDSGLCVDPVTIPGANLSTGNQSFPGVNYGTIPFNATGNITATKILGLSTNFFFTLAALLVLTIIATTIHNLRLGLVTMFIGLIFFVDVMKIISFPSTLVGLVLVVVIAYVVKGVKL